MMVLIIPLPVLKKKSLYLQYREKHPRYPYGSVKALFKLNFSGGSLKRVLKPNKANVAMGETPNSDVWLSERRNL